MVADYLGIALEQAPLLAALITAYMAGAATPFGYVIERLRGFGRASVSRLPYEPPPGMEREEALRRVSTAHDVGADPDGEDDADAQK